MVEVALEGMEFYAFHGFYEYERRTGNNYTVDVKVVADTDLAGDTENIDNTVNYEIIYKEVKEEMNTPSLLLETIAYNISRRIFDRFPIVKSAEVAISKHNPPVGGVCAKSKVTFKCQR
ncbi:MAG TPA: dihydroneopterin aldolase [Cytophagaceae bacterium]